MNEYFRELRTTCRKIDSDIQKLEKTWAKPHFLISGHGENVEEASTHVENFLSEIKEIQDQMIQDRVSWTKNIAGVDEYLSSSETSYRDLEQQCQEVEILLSEYGYKRQAESPECDSSFMTGSETESSILTTEQMEHSISSPCSVKPGIDEVLDTSATNLSNPKSIATPVIKRLASVKGLGNLTGSNFTSTCYNQKNEFYSPY